MGLPARLLSQTVTRVRPTKTTDAYGSDQYDYGVTATRTTYPGGTPNGAWIEQQSRTEPLTDGRDPLVESWLLMLNESDVDGRDRFEWIGPNGTLTFEVDGPPRPVHTPAGFHHTEATLRAVAG
jgi:hypothetical protein